MQIQDDFEVIFPNPNAATQIRILLVDDQPFIQRVLLGTLETQTDFQVVGQAETGQRALQLIEELHPHVALVDIEMPGMDGLDTTQAIHQRFPDTKVLVLSGYDDEAYIRKALLAGAQGYLMKNTPSEELAHAIRFVHLGYVQLGPGLFEKLSSQGTTPSLSLSQPANSSQLQPLAPQGSLQRSPTLGSLQTNDTQEEWSISTRELVDTLPQLWSRGLLYLLLVFATVIAVWAMLFQVDEVGRARGRLEPKGKTTRLDAPVEGKVANVLVREGQVVNAGQPILELDSEIIHNDLSQIQTKLDGQLSRLVQLEGIRNQLRLAIVAQQQQNQAQASEKAAQLQQAQQTLSTNQVSLPLQTSEKLAQLKQAEQDLKAAEDAAILAENRWQKDQAEIGRYKRLQQDGIVPEIQIVQAERTADESLRLRDQAKAEILKAQQRLQEQESNYEKLMQQLNSDLKQAKNRLAEQESNQQSLLQSGELALLKGQQQLKEVESQIVDLHTEITQAQSQEKSLGFQIKQRIVRAPIQGTVFQLPIQHPGAVLQVGQMVAQIAPQDSRWILRAQLSSKDSGFVRVGLPARIKFDAYPFQNYGIVSGRVSWVSPDSKPLSPQLNLTSGTQSTQDEGFFELEIQLQQDYIQTYNQRIVLKPGQTAVAEVVTRQRRVIDFFLDPFRGLQDSKLGL